MFQKSRFVKLRSWLCVVRHQRLKNVFKLNYQLRNDINKKNSELLLEFDLAGWFYHYRDSMVSKGSL